MKMQSMKSVKQGIMLMMIMMLGVIIYISIYHDDGVDVENRIFPEGMSTKERCLLIQKEWLAMKKMELDSMNVTNLISNLVREKGSHLSNEQKIKLSQKLTAWLFHLKTGEYEDFMEFREPDYHTITLKNLRNYAKYLHGIDKTNALDHLPKSEWIRPAFEHGQEFRLVTLRPDSIHLNVRNFKMKSKADDVLNIFTYYPGGGHSHITKLHYRVKPEDVMKKHRGVEWARFRVAMDCPNEEQVYCIPIQLALYWEPDEKRWLAGAQYWASPLGHLEMGKMVRTLFLYF